NVVRVVIDSRTVARAEILLEGPQFMGYRIQNAGVLFASGQALLRVCAVTEQALESHARINFSGKRRCRVRPGNGIRVRAAITPIAVAEISSVFYAKLKRRQNRVVAILV